MDWESNILSIVHWSSLKRRPVSSNDLSTGNSFNQSLSPRVLMALGNTIFHPPKRKNRKRGVENSSSKRWGHEVVITDSQSSKCLRSKLWESGDTSFPFFLYHWLAQDLPLTLSFTFNLLMQGEIHRPTNCKQRKTRNEPATDRWHSSWRSFLGSAIDLWSYPLQTSCISCRVSLQCLKVKGIDRRCMSFRRGL